MLSVVWCFCECDFIQGGVSSSTKLVASSPPDVIIPIESSRQQQKSATEVIRSPRHAQKSYVPPAESASSEKKSTSSITIPFSNSSPSSTPFIEETNNLTSVGEDIRKRKSSPAELTVDDRIDQLSR